MMIDYFRHKFGEEGEFICYTLPAINRAQQALGRVLRTPEDRGFLVFGEKRFLEPKVHNGLPPWIRDEMIAVILYSGRWCQNGSDERLMPAGVLVRPCLVVQRYDFSGFVFKITLKRNGAAFIHSLLCWERRKFSVPGKRCHKLSDNIWTNLQGGQESILWGNHYLW